MHSFIRRLVDASGVTLRHTWEDKAYFTPAMDRITLPHGLELTDRGSYLNKLFHELGHAAGMPHRAGGLPRKSLDFDPAQGSFVSIPSFYAIEELVAETVSMFLCRLFKVQQEMSDWNSKYVGSFLQHLEDNGDLHPDTADRVTTEAGRRVRWLLDKAGIDPRVFTS